MKWEPEALAEMREWKTNCSDFIYTAAEYLAEINGHESVTVDDVEMVLKFIEANTTNSNPPSR